MECERSCHGEQSEESGMLVDQETQSFLNLYVKPGSKIYTPPATVDPEGDLASSQHFQEVAAQEVELLDEIASVQFYG